MLRIAPAAQLIRYCSVLHVFILPHFYGDECARERECVRAGGGGGGGDGEWVGGGACVHG